MHTTHGVPCVNTEQACTFVQLFLDDDDLSAVYAHAGVSLSYERASLMPTISLTTFSRMHQPWCEFRRQKVCYTEHRGHLHLQDSTQVEGQMQAQPHVPYTRTPLQEPMARLIVERTGGTC